MYVHKTEIRGQDQTSDFTTIQSDERWTPRALSFKHSWLSNPFSVTNPWSQIKPFLTCVIIKRKMEKRSRFYSCSTIHPLNPCYTLCHWHCNILFEYKGYGMRVREGMKPPSDRSTIYHKVSTDKHIMRAIWTERRNWSNWRTHTQTWEGSENSS